MGILHSSNVSNVTLPAQPVNPYQIVPHARVLMELLTISMSPFVLLPVQLISMAMQVHLSVSNALINALHALEGQMLSVKPVVQ
jgi:hypothetical protein